MAREIVSGVGIASDFIVGFPGETEEDYAATESLMRECRFQQCFVFKYSPRPGTPSTRLDDDVPDAIKRERNNRLLDIQMKIQKEDNAALAGAQVKVLAEGPSKRDRTRWTGRTPENRIAVFAPNGAAPGEIIQLRVERTNALTLFCEKSS